MRKQLQGIGLILFGILLCVGEINFRTYTILAVSPFSHLPFWGSASALLVWCSSLARRIRK